MMCASPRTITAKNRLKMWQRNPTEKLKPLIVPCGKCFPCLSNKRHDWSFRLEQEHRYSRSSLFVTLTYDRKHLPENWSLKKRDLQLFFKRLRKHELNSRIRYYAVGEYGSKTGRPHYHAIIFNANEETVRKAWSLGMVHVGKVNQASIKYTLKYIVQPDLKPHGKQPPFSLMSRAYGLGLNYLTDNILRWHREGKRNFAISDGHEVRLPKYFRDKIWHNEDERSIVSDESKWKAIKARRKELRYFVEQYGAENAKRYMTEFRDAVIKRIKVKVSFTQKF